MAEKKTPEKKSAAPLLVAPAPRFAREVTGHGELIGVLTGMIRAKTFPTGLLLTGPEGTGKATLAWCVAKLMMGAENIADEEGEIRIPSTDPVAANMEAGGHPDMRAPEPERSAASGVASFPVDKIREATSFLSKTASGPLGKKCVLLDGADLMNAQAQNALLKALEEPSGDAHFILVCSRPEALLPTVRSRCIRLKAKPLIPDECARVLERAAPDFSPDARAAAAAAAEQSPGVACALLAAGLTDFRAAVWRALRDQASGKEPVIPEAADKPEHWRLTLGVLARVTRDLSVPDALLPQEMSAEERMCRMTLVADGGEALTRRLAEVLAMAARHGETLYLDKRNLLRLYFAAAAQVG